MELARKRELVTEHLRAEGAGDVDGAVAVYTNDVEHDVVGWPGSPAQGRQAARDFYTHLTANFRTETETPLHTYAADDFLVMEQQMTGTVIGQMLGLPGNSRTVSFRILHVFEFAEDAISREQVWLDGGSITAQLTA